VGRGVVLVAGVLTACSAGETVIIPAPADTKSVLTIYAQNAGVVRTALHRNGIAIGLMLLESFDLARLLDRVTFRRNTVLVEGH